MEEKPTATGAATIWCRKSGSARYELAELPRGIFILTALVVRGKSLHFSAKNFPMRVIGPNSNRNEIGFSPEALRLFGATPMSNPPMSNQRSVGRFSVESPVSYESSRWRPLREKSRTLPRKCERRWPSVRRAQPGSERSGSSTAWASRCP
jgi:hypothetical protein